MDPIPTCDILIFVATRSEERALIAAAHERGVRVEPRDGALGPFYWFGHVGPNRVVAVRTAMGPLGYRGSGARAVHYVSATQATGAISVGMAFGCDPGSQELGDVIVGTQIVPYDNRDVRSDDTGAPVVDYARVRRRRAKNSLVRMMERGAQQQQRQRVHFGALLSGAARIHCAAYRDHLRDAVPQQGDRIVGGEMEGVGLLSASDPNDPNWIVVKAICDFADEQRDDVIEDWRSAASTQAATFVLGALAAGPCDLGANDEPA